MKNKLYPTIAIIALAVLFTVFSETAAQSALDSMENCIKNIIPSLFPFMVISSMITNSDASEILGKIFPIAKLYSLPLCASAPIIIGSICGFPLGAKAATELYERGYISKTETEVLISVSNNTGPSFIIFVIGAKYWNDIKFGIFLYIAQIICSVIAGIIVNRLIFPPKHLKAFAGNTVKCKETHLNIAKSISSASFSSLTICGFITFFSSFNSVLSNLLCFAPINLKLTILGILEFSDASLLSSEYKSIFCVFICGFAIGWSGLSVFCQTLSFTSALKLSLKRCVLTNLIQGILLGFSSVIYFTKINTNMIINKFINTPLLQALLFVILTLFCICIIYIIKKCKGA